MNHRTDDTVSGLAHLSLRRPLPPVAATEFVVTVRTNHGPVAVSEAFASRAIAEIWKADHARLVQGELKVIPVFRLKPQGSPNK
jgi:hypothetical protein